MPPPGQRRMSRGVIAGVAWSRARAAREVQRHAAETTADREKHALGASLGDDDVSMHTEAAAGMSVLPHGRCVPCQDGTSTRAASSSGAFVTRSTPRSPSGSTTCHSASGQPEHDSSSASASSPRMARLLIEALCIEEAGIPKTSPVYGIPGGLTCHGDDTGRPLSAPRATVPGQPFDAIGVELRGEPGSREVQSGCAPAGAVAAMAALCSPKASAHLRIALICSCVHRPLRVI